MINYILWILYAFEVKSQSSQNLNIFYNCNQLNYGNDVVIYHTLSKECWIRVTISFSKKMIYETNGQD